MATAEYLSLAEAFNVYFLQVPTYHLILELVLVAGIVTLYFSKSFGPRPKPAEKPTREVSSARRSAPQRRVALTTAQLCSIRAVC